MRKVLILSWSDLFGGAAQAANEIYKSLKRKKNVHFFVQNKISSDRSIKTYNFKTFNLYLRKFFSFFLYKIRLSKNDYSYNLINSDIVKISKFNQYDVVNLHWINSETLSIFDISKIKKKMVLTLHDMWFMNGTEHYLYYLPKQYYKNGNYIKLNFFDHLIWKIKKKILKKKKIHIVAPSKWIAKLAQKSKILNGFPITTIPYAVDNKIFFKSKIRSIKVGKNKIFKKKNTIDVLFVSAGGLFNYRKGFDLLDQCISKYDKNNKVRLLIVGPYKNNDIKKIQSSNIILGNLKNKKLLNKVYNFSDIIAIPSRLDNLPNVALEAQSCGLPIVTYKVGGLTDIVEHKKNGFLIKPFDIKSFYDGINNIYKNKVKFEKNSLIKSKIWKPKNISKQYIKLFNEL